MIFRYSAFRSHFRKSASARAGVVGLLFILLLAIVFATFVATSLAQGIVTCDTQLSGQIGAPRSLCLKPISISVLSTNSSEENVPVLMMKPGSSASLTILYHQILKSTIDNPQMNLSAADIPYAMSAISGAISKQVLFSTGKLIFRNGSSMIYKYTFNASSGSAGYYAILVPFAYGMLPALVVGGNPNSLNMTTMSLWGYVGPIVSTETLIPSVIVGVGNLKVTNVTVPEMLTCQTAGCLDIARSNGL